MEQIRGEGNGFLEVVEVEVEEVEVEEVEVEVEEVKGNRGCTASESRLTR
jgi:hypothetical protein